MRLVIGILLGAFIIFNWSDIRSFMDEKVSGIKNQEQHQTAGNKSEESENNDVKDDEWGKFR
jgi:hypothetical protein